MIRLLCAGHIEFVQAAFALDTKESQLLFIADLVNRTRRVMITDAQITLLPQRVIRQVVPLEVSMHVAIGPVGNYVYFPAVL
jgi:hypothetical protein